MVSVKLLIKSMLLVIAWVDNWLVILVDNSRRLANEAQLLASLVSIKSKINLNFHICSVSAIHLFIFLALDPAKPWFDVSAASNTISKDDAQFVDVMHTNSGFLLNVRKFILTKKVISFHLTF